MENKGFYGNIPAKPHELTDRITPQEKFITLCHLGIPDIAANSWRLRVEGLVDHPTTYGFNDLKSFAKREVESVHQCAGSPLNPTAPTQRVCNVVWGGAWLADLLQPCGIKAQARYIWSFGSDYGEFAGETCDSYGKDFPLERLAQDVLVAYEMNGEPLRSENGYPARLVVPGYYGTNSVKWLSRIRLAAQRASGPFTTKWYNDDVEGPDGEPSGRTRPVWSIAPQSVIVFPGPSGSAADSHREIWGWAWADGGVDRVEVSLDAGETWSNAEVEPRTQMSWQRFSTAWPDAFASSQMLMSRATSRNGEIQPSHSRRNAIFAVQVEPR